MFWVSKSIAHGFLFLFWCQLRFPPDHAGSVENVEILDLNDMKGISDGILPVETQQREDGGLEVTLKDSEAHPFLRSGILVLKKCCQCLPGFYCANFPVEAGMPSTGLYHL